MLTFSVPARSRRLFCQPCLDWSERRYHIKGRVGAGLLCRCMELGWFKHMRDSRALKLTPEGRDGLAEVFGVVFDGDVRPAETKDAARLLLRA